MLARDLMTTSVLTVSPATPVQRIAQLLLEHGISSVPVVATTFPSASSARPISSRDQTLSTRRAATGSCACWPTASLSPPISSAPSWRTGRRATS